MSDIQMIPAVYRVSPNRLHQKYYYRGGEYHVSNGVGGVQICASQ